MSEVSQELGEKWGKVKVPGKVFGKTPIEFDPEAQKKMAIPLGERELFPSVGTRLSEALIEGGVTTAFGCPGGHMWHFLDEMSRAGIKEYVFAFEGQGVYAAEGYTQVMQGRKTAVCFGTVGPGAANAFSAMQQAWLSCSPIIFLAGGHEKVHDDLRNTLQESYAYKFYESITKWAYRLSYPWQVKQCTARMCKLCQSAPKGPCAFEINCDPLMMKDEARKHYWGGFFSEDEAYIEAWRYEDTSKPLTSAADPAEVAKAARALAAAKAPYLVIGEDAAWEDCGAECKEFVEYWKIPHNNRRTGRALISELHPYYHRGYPPFKSEIDLMIIVGVKVGFFDAYGGGWAPTIQFANAESRVWTYLKSPAVLMGTIKITLRQVLDYAKANNLGPSLEAQEWLKKCQASHVAAIEKRKAHAYMYGPDHPRYRKYNIIHFGYMSQIIREVCHEEWDDKPRVCIDGYTLSDFVMPYLQFSRPASCVSANDQAGVGHGVGQAIGMAIAQQELGEENIPVLPLMGDSGMMNGGWDCEVAVRFKLPIVYLVTNNGGWMPGMKYPWYGPNWDILGDQDRLGETFRGVRQQGPERPLIDFAKFADSIGARGMHVDREDKLKDSLKEAMAYSQKNGPVILDCIMDQHQTNRAVTGPVYSLFYAHIPWDELPPRGKASRAAYLPHWFAGLKDEVGWKVSDPWEPLSEDEFGYAPRDDYFKA